MGAGGGGPLGSSQDGSPRHMWSMWTERQRGRGNRKVKSLTDNKSSNFITKKLQP